MKPLLVFGLDGCSPATMTQYVETHADGLFAHVAKNGHFAHLRSTWPYFTAPAWTTFATGLHPSWHGVFHWRSRYDRNLQRRPLISSEHLAQATFWAWVQENGGRVAVSNFPMEYPAPAVAGRYICGTLAPENASNTTWPDGLAARIKSELPGFRFEMDKGLSYQDRPQELREHILEVGENHYAAMSKFIDPASADFFLHVVTITDRMQHFFWHRHDPSHPLAEPHANEADPVIETYVRAERELETLWASGRFKNLVILSDHGMGTSFEAFHTDTWLVSNGYAVAAADGKVDIERSQAYSAEEPECAIYVNRQDRDGFGLAGDQYDALIKDLVDRLQGVRRLDGTPAFRQVFDAREIHKGPMASKAPDVILYPSEGIHPRPKVSPSVFSADARLTAGHRPEGIFMAIGEDVLPETGPSAPLEMVDLFPIMCQLMGIATPGDLHGQVPAFASGKAVEIAKVSWPQRVGNDILMQAETADMHRRLKELGYAED